MKPSRKTKPGIEKTHWKVGEADDFHSLDTGQDADIEPAPSEYYEAYFDIEHIKKKQDN